MRRLITAGCTIRPLAAVLFAAAIGSAPSMVLTAPLEPPPVPQCRVNATLTRVAELYEGSGLTASRRTPGRFWAHNDSDPPVLHALDATGAVVGRVRLAGAKVEDWEGMTAGPCPAGMCLYVGDIGDNDARRRRITIYRLPEPAAPTGTVTAEAIHATYPDGAHDAEALFFSPGGRLHIVTKGDTGSVAIYRFPQELRPGSSVRLERVGAPRASGRPEKEDRITDAAIDPDGRWIVLRSTHTLMFHRASDLLQGTWREIGRVSVESLREPQGEGLTFGSDGSIVLLGEGGRKKEPGTFVRLPCARPAG